MKVLWFSNTQSLASNEVSKGTGNWISSLEKQMKSLPNIELAIAFHVKNSKELKVKKSNSVTYFFLPFRYSSMLRKLWNNWMGDIHDIYNFEVYDRVVEQFKPDVIHIFGFENLFVKILPRYSDITVVHIQGIVNVCNHFIYGGFRRIDIFRATSIGNLVKGNFYAKAVSRLKRMSFIEAKAFQQVKYVFGRTEWDKRVSLAMAPQAEYFHCHEIMRDEFYKNTWNKTRSDELIFYTTLNDYPYKGPDQIFYINEVLRRFHPDLKYKWRIAGIDETSICIKAMRKKKFKNTPNLEFLGKLSAAQIVEEMKASDLFIYTSLIENGCNAVQEAMLLGMPIVCTSAGGMTSTVVNMKTGLTVQPGDPYAMAGAIIDLINNPRLASELGKRAREKALTRHNGKAIASTVLGTYFQIINSNKKHLESVSE